MDINIPPYFDYTQPMTTHIIPIPDTPQQQAIHKVLKVSLSCTTDDHRIVLDNMMDNLYNLYGYDTWHDAKCLITRT